MFTDDFNRAYRQWRASRPAWANLVKAVRSDAPDSELQRLAADAGAGQEEINELLTLRKSALRRQEGAARFPAAKKELERLDREIAKAQAIAESSSAFGLDAAEGAVRAAMERRSEFARNEFCGPELAANLVATARAAGVF